MQELTVVSSLDNSPEPVLFSAAEGNQPRPLLVGLHTWSAERSNQRGTLLPLARERNWHLLLPEFRGPNLANNPRAGEACGSALARQDILDAVAQVREQEAVGPIFLYGGSGGGHMALMMAATAPKFWTAISSWCPITDLFKWREENENYRAHIEACCGGVPDDGEEVRASYRERSPYFYAEQIAQSTLSIHHGKWDKAVPFTHSLNLYQQILYHRPNANVFCEIFDGAHDAHAPRAVAWFEEFLEGEHATENLRKLTG